MSRRLHRWSAAAAALALAMSACATADGNDDRAVPTPGVAASPTAAAVGCSAGETDGDLSFYTWADYIDPALIAAFEERYGVAVRQAFYPSNEELLAVLESGTATYDVIVPSDYIVTTMRERDLLLELDRDAIPNATNIAPTFADPPYDPGNRYSQPYQWGSAGLGVDTSVVGDDVEPSWDLVFDPEVASRYAGRIALLDDPRETLAAALLHLGRSPNTTDEEDLRAAAELVSEARARGVVFRSDGYTDLLLSGEVAIAHGFSANFRAAFVEADVGDRYRYVVPREGATRWADTVAIPVDARHPCTAHAFIDFLLEPENGARLTNWNGYASPNAAAERHILPQLLSDPALYPGDDVGLWFLEEVGRTHAIYDGFFADARG